ncbi:MAG: hypothetical protein DF280_00830 ['Brassica napus' phytoplasma]|nr:MAG: hypothetical protein DF280_00830 ['Brassica napus' phytoplasma]
MRKEKKNVNFRFKKQLYLFQIVLFTFFYYFFITNNPQVMATCNNNSEGKLKKNIDIIEEAVDTLEENIKFF